MIYKMPLHYAGFDFLSSMVVVVNPEGRILYANIAFKNLFGIFLPTSKHLMLTDLFKNKSLPQLLKSISREDLSSAHIEDELNWSNGQDVFPVSVSFSQSNNADEIIVEMFHLALQAKQGKEKRLSEQSRANKEMIRNLAHEVKNPLGGIRGAAQLIQMEAGVSQDLIEYTNVIIHEVDRLQALVDRLLEPHRKAQVLESVNIHEVCEYVAALIFAEYGSGVRVVRDYDASIPEIKADKSQLIQVVLNIAKNACDALKKKIGEGGAVLEFRSRVVKQMVFSSKCRFGMALELHIIDNGEGIPEDMQERIFYPLVSGKDNGTGLGLTLAQIFIHQHQGLIECISRPEFTDFKITLPLYSESTEKNECSMDC